MDAKHYHTGTIQAIDLIEAYELDFCLGNAVKYISRAGRKGDAVEDLRKAIWYIERRIRHLTNDKTSTLEHPNYAELNDHKRTGGNSISGEVQEVFHRAGKIYTAG